MGHAQLLGRVRSQIRGLKFIVCSEGIARKWKAVAIYHRLKDSTPARSRTLHGLTVPLSLRCCGQGLFSSSASFQCRLFCRSSRNQQAASCRRRPVPRAVGFIPLLLTVLYHIESQSVLHFRSPSSFFWHFNNRPRLSTRDIKGNYIDNKLRGRYFNPTARSPEPSPYELPR